MTLTPGQVVTRLLGRKPAAMLLMAGGRNNQVYRVELGDGQTRLAKFYPNEGPGSRDRLNSEFRSLEFLWENQVGSVPHPLLADAEARCGIYEYIQGESIDSAKASADDVDQTVQFVDQLNALHCRALATDLPIASDACFSFQELQATIDHRLQRLEGAAADNPELASFLTEDFAPCYADVSASVTGSGADLGLGMGELLPLQHRALSPSDFGFHNAIRRPDGRVAFVDFEYFGWDDPAKMISDYLLHPAQELGQDLRRRFLDGCLESFKTWPGVAQRLDLVYPLCGLKWCLLILNEFLPDYVARRTHARGYELDLSDLQGQQLDKARRMLARVQNSDAAPY